MEFEKIQNIIADVLNTQTDAITMDTRFIDDLGADSLDLFQIVMEIEEAFNIVIDDSELDHIVTVGDAVSAIKTIG